MFIESAWLLYAKCVLPADAPDIQRRECRMAFYGGAASLLGNLLATLSPGQDVTDADIEEIASIRTELDQFCAEQATN